MSNKLPALTGIEVIRALKRAGFDIVRIRGSHHILRHSDGRGTVVPVHSRDIVGSGLVSKILRDCQLDKEEFRSLLG